MTNLKNNNNNNKKKNSVSLIAFLCTFFFFSVGLSHADLFRIFSFNSSCDRIELVLCLRLFFSDFCVVGLFFFFSLSHSALLLFYFLSLSCSFSPFSVF